MTWKTAKLGEVCTIEKGNIGIMKAIPGEYPLVVLGKERKTHNEFQFDDEAVIIPLVSSTGHGHRSMNRIFHQTGKFSIGSILCAVIPKDKTQLSAEFLYRYLDFNKENELVARMRGMANVTLPMKEIADVEIPLPPLDVQKELIEEFQQLESGTNQISTELNHQLALVKELRQAYLREAMQGKLVAQDVAGEPAEILLEKIKAEKEKLVAEKRIRRDKPLPPINAEEIPFEIPSNWTWCRLGEIYSELLGGFAFESTRYSQNSNNQVIRLGNVKNNKIVLETSPVFIDDDYAKAVSNAELKSGDILITMTGTRAKRDYLFTLLLDENNFCGKRLFLNQRVGCFRFSSSSSKNFMNIALKDIRLLEPVFDSATGAANQANIGVTALKNVLIPLPPLAEQERIVAKLEKLMKFCDELEANINCGIANADQLLQTALKEALEPK